MAFSEYLSAMRGKCRELIEELSKYFDYVSVLGSDAVDTIYRVNKKSSSAQEGDGERGFVFKMNKGGAIFEYSTSDISATPRLSIAPSA